ncbi:hypothetical protein HHI36_015078 [Cryptolaemus montrouzieri]|uniref:Uncharacterized protein n=1 Tax=Cryptolaemus montrouzieri TaxID=559131 RepID=A0ABD2N4L7_9CUCU
MNANSMNQAGPSRFVSEFDITEEEENSIGVPSFSSQPIEEEFPGSHPTFSQPLQYFEANEDIQQKSDEFLEVEIGQPSWKNPVGNHQVFDYTADAGLSPNYAATLVNSLSPYGCFRAIVDNDIKDEKVNQTISYATQKLCDTENISIESRFHKWFSTDKKKSSMVSWDTWVL